jgi:O-antigen/teichoic acid export membrane protein
MNVATRRQEPSLGGPAAAWSNGTSASPPADDDPSADGLAPAGGPAASASASPDRPEVCSKKRTVLGGGLWVICGYGANQVVRFGFNLIFTRLLLPEAFGLMALVNAVLIALQGLSDLGLRPAVIHKECGEDPRFLNTAWTLQMIRGFGLWLCSALLAWPIAAFYGNPLLLGLIPAAAGYIAIAGVNSMSLNVLSRRLRQAPLVTLQVGSYFIGMAFAVVLIRFWDADVWGFVAGSVLASLLTMVVSHFLLPGFRHRLCWDRAALAELKTYGFWLFLSTCCSFLAEQADRLLIGKLLSLHVLGIYQLAHALAWLPVSLMYILGTQIIFPLYSRLYRSPQGLGERLRLIHPLWLGLGALMVSALIGAGPDVVNCLYGHRYHEAGWMTQVLGAVAWLKMLESATDALLLGIGHMKAVAVNNGLRLVILGVLMPLGYYSFGLPGLLAGLGGAALLRYLCNVWALGRRGLSVFRYDFLLTLGIAAVSGAALFVRNLPWGLEHKWLQLLEAAAVVVLMWGTLGLGVWSGRLLLTRAAAQTP